MKYVMDCLNERGLHIELEEMSDCVKIEIKDDIDNKMIFLDEEGLYELIGVLHHIQKKLK